MKDFKEAFEDLIKDMYSAETQVVEALPKAAAAAENSDLSAGFMEHCEQSKMHVQRLEEVASTCGFEPTGKTCEAAKGLIKEMDEIISEGESGPVRDAMLICGGQKFEHYEMANYGTAVTWAMAIGQQDCADLLAETLQEEEETDAKLTEIAETVVNPEAVGSMSGKASLK
jgi:ferritin-like metal-binding protein YciE